nr:hypothetical protein [Ktedonobacteraceae bacterium]
MKERTSATGPFLPGDGSNKRLYIDQSVDALRVTLRPGEAQRGAPVMDNKDDVLL